MRYLIYALQSSGSSLFAYLLSQRSNTIGIIDLYNQELAPSHSEFPSDIDVILKCTVSKFYTIKDHIESFEPHKVIYFTRDYQEVEKSLITKSYSELGGTISEKINHFDACKDFIFDYRYSFSDMMNKKNMWLIYYKYYSLSRSLTDIIEFNKAKSKWCEEGLGTKWFVGNIHLQDGRSANELTFTELQSASVKNPFI